MRARIWTGAIVAVIAVIAVAATGGAAIGAATAAVARPIASALPGELVHTNGSTVLSVDETGRSLVVRNGPFGAAASAARIDRLSGVVTSLPIAVAASADGSALVTERKEWYDVATLRTTVVPAPTDFTRYLLSADGRTYVAGRWGPDGRPDGSVAVVVDGPTGRSAPFPIPGLPTALSADGRWVLIETGCRDIDGLAFCDVVRWDRTTGARTTVGRADALEAVAGTVADTGRVLVFSSFGVTPMAVLRDPGRADRPVPPTKWLSTGGQFSRDGAVYGWEYIFTSCCWS